MNRTPDFGKRVIFRIETQGASTKTLPCKEGETAVVLKAAMMKHLLSSVTTTGKSVPLTPNRYLLCHMPSGQVFMDFTPIEWVIKATGQSNKKVKQLNMLCIDIGREETAETMKNRQTIVEDVVAKLPKPEVFVPTEAVIKTAEDKEEVADVKQSIGTSGCGNITMCTACTSDTWSKLEGCKKDIPCSVCDLDSKNLFVCGGCGTEVCDQCISPDAKLQGDDDDDASTEKYDVDDYVDTRRWKTVEVTLQPGELGIMFGPKTFRNRFDTSYDADPETFICVHELDDDSQVMDSAEKVMKKHRKITDTLPWIITELNGEKMPNAGQKATGNTDDEVDDDIDTIFDAMQAACGADKGYTMKFMYLDEVSRALGNSRSGCRRGGRRC